MVLNGQKIIPAARSMKLYENFLDSPFETGILLDIHIANLKSVFQLAHSHGKKIIVHADLVQGLKNDEYAAEFLIQEMKPFGLISTRSSVIAKAKQKGILAIQRVFLLDSQAWEKSCLLLEKTKPDFIEVLPGAMPEIIREIGGKVSLPILAGGFIRSIGDVKRALEAGAVGVTTSTRDIWEKDFQKELVR